mgnify:CR=1 FL=1
MDNGKIKISRLFKSYGTHMVLAGFSAEFEKGKTTCVMAPSGAGKTTLLRILAGLEEADSGSIEGMEEMKKSMVFQEDRLCENLSASANIRLVRQKKPWGRDREEVRQIPGSNDGGRTVRVRGSAGPGTFRRYATAGCAFTGTLLRLGYPVSG